MTTTPPPLPDSPADDATSSVAGRPSGRLRDLAFAGLCLIGAGALVAALWRPAVSVSEEVRPLATHHRASATVAAKVDEEFRQHWQDQGIEATEPAPMLATARRLSLALTGSLPSLEEIRELETIAADRQLEWWVDHLLDDRRSADYLAERFARAYVGVETGPFLVYRRNRLVSWLSDELHANRRYDELARELIAADGVWTSEPAANFITVTIDQNEQNKGPDEVKLAARVTRAFLGVRIDCMQCHDDKFGDRWKQEDFHQLAAFFAEAEVSVSGIHDKPGVTYETRMRGEAEPEPVAARVPFAEALYPAEGSGTPRQKLAVWVTHPENAAFARATVNRIWALMFNRPLVEPIDDLPLDGPFPPGLETLAADLVANDFDLRHLIRTIAATEVFRLDSRSDDAEHPVSDDQQEHWASFPLTRLRPDQVAGSISQSASLATIDADAHIIRRLASFGESNEFIRRFGDLGEDEFNERAGTIPQRLLMMNGKVVRERTKQNPVMNASTRIGVLAPDDDSAVESAFLAALTRRPTEAEQRHFVDHLAGTRGDARARAMEDLYWVLLNSTEFSWNH